MKVDLRTRPFACHPGRGEPIPQGERIGALTTVTGTAGSHPMFPAACPRQEDFALVLRRRLNHRSRRS